MIILGKNYNVADNHVVVRPIAKIEDNKIIVIDKAKRADVFPNKGRIYTPKYHARLTPGNFMIYELELSHTYDRNNENSHYYTVNQLKVNTHLFEVFKIDESFENEPDLIVEKVRNGFRNLVEVLPNILLETSDKYLLGPFKSEYDAGNAKVEIVDNFEIDKYIIPVYDNSRNQLDIATYYDSFREIYRHFTLTYPEKENVINELDIATNDYIVRDTIRALRGREEFGDITRRVSQGINEWLKHSTFSEEFNMKRLKKTIKLIKEIAPEHENNNYQKYTSELLSLPSVNNIIDEQTEGKFKLEYENFLKENKEILSENKDLKVEHSTLNHKVEAEEKKLSRLQQDIEKYKKFMSIKKANIEEEILSHYFQKIIGSNLFSNSKEQSNYILTEELLDPTETIESLDEIKKVLKHNLKQYGERDINNLILNYCLITLKFNQPLIIVGESSFKLAEIIQKSFAASNSQAIIPTTTEFNIDIFDIIKEKQQTPLNFTRIHNINISPMALNLTGIIKQYESKETNNKLIFTFDSFDDSRFILEQLKSFLILDIDQRSFFSSPFDSKENLKLGQLDYKILKTFLTPKLDFEESLENLLDGILDNEQVIEEDIVYDLKNMFIRLTYANQIIGDGQKALNYFPFLKESLIGEQDA